MRPVSEVGHRCSRPPALAYRCVAVWGSAHPRLPTGRHAVGAFTDLDGEGGETRSLMRLRAVSADKPSRHRS